MTKDGMTSVRSGAQMSINAAKSSLAVPLYIGNSSSYELWTIKISKLDGRRRANSWRKAPVVKVP
jgi:hypothetical protein